MHRDIEKVLIDAEKIRQRVDEVAAQISATYIDRSDGLTIVAIMTGALVFTADLIRRLPLPLKLNLATVSSYAGPRTSPTPPVVMTHGLVDIAGRDILLVDDILDSGGTLKSVFPVLENLGAGSIKVCVLLRKDRPSARAVPADFVAFDIPDEFVIGYGLDYDNSYRNLPEICTLKQKVYAKNIS